MNKKVLVLFRELFNATTSFLQLCHFPLDVFQEAGVEPIKLKLPYMASTHCCGLFPGGETSLCRANGYVPPTRVDFSLPKIQNRPQILKFYSRTGPTFLSFTPEQDPFSQAGLRGPAQMSKSQLLSAFVSCSLMSSLLFYYT